MEKLKVDEPVSISSYSGYNHNRYDGYNCSWGVLMAFGASPTADCFADDEDYPNDEFIANYNGENHDIYNGETGEYTAQFIEDVLSNLNDDDIEEINDLNNGDEYETSQYYGESISIVFHKENNIIHCNFDGHTFIVTLD